MFHKDQFKISYIFFINISDCSKTIHGKYQKLLLANDTVSFPTCKTNASTSAIDNIFIARTKIYTIYPFINGLSDHETQILVIENIVLPKQRNNITTKGHQWSKYTGISITTKSWELGRNLYGGWCHHFSQ